jgi:hypothetical protein
MLFRGKLRLLSVVVSIIAILSLTAWPALAQEGPSQSPGDQASGGEAELLTTDSGSGLISVIARSQTSPLTTTSTAFVDVPGAATTHFLAAGASDLFLAEFSAETTNCSGTGFNFCQVQVVVVQAGVTTVFNPNGPGVTFDSESSDDESHSHQWTRRVANNTSAGQFITVKPRWNCTPGPCSFSIDDYTFTVMRFN